MQRVITFFQGLIISIYSILIFLVALIIASITLNKKLMVWMARKFWAPLLLRIGRIQLNISGAENIKKNTPYIFVCNHISFFDIPCLFSALPTNIYFVAKKELQKIPVVGWFIALSGMIFVDRSNHDKAMKSIAKAGELIKNGKSVVMFAEGTRSKTGEIQKFKKGAFLMALNAIVPIAPVSIKYSQKVIKKGMLRKTKVRVIIAEPLPPDEFQSKTTVDLMNMVRKIVVDNFNTISFH